MKLARKTLDEIAAGREATRAEIEAMAHELVAIREEEAKTDDGTVAVKIEHTGKEGTNGWFSTRAGRIPRAQFHVGARVSMSGRVYRIVEIEGDHVRVR